MLSIASILLKLSNYKKKTSYFAIEKKKGKIQNSITIKKNKRNKKKGKKNQI